MWSIIKLIKEKTRSMIEDFQFQQLLERMELIQQHTGRVMTEKQYDLFKVFEKKYNYSKETTCLIVENLVEDTYGESVHDSVSLSTIVRQAELFEEIQNQKGVKVEIYKYFKKSFSAYYKNNYRK